MSFWKDFWCGKEKTLVFDTKPATATIKMEDGSTHRITRNGSSTYEFGFHFSYTGEEFLKKYLSNSKHHMLISDDGAMFSVYKINSIELEVRSEEKTIKYR